jgi:hypothetical protein
MDAGLYPDPHKISEDLHAFAKLNEQRLYRLYSTCGDLQTDLKGLVKATVSILLRPTIRSNRVASLDPRTNSPNVSTHLTLASRRR